MNDEIHVTSADPFEAAATLAAEANDRGTFGVGGVLLDAEGRVVGAARNAVIVGGRLADPTAHVERQLLEQFEAQRANGWRADRLTVVSSLEPCMMCAGSLLRAGVRCVALSEDDFAGVGIRGGLPSLPPELRARAAALFGLAEVVGARESFGARSSVLRQPARRESLTKAEQVFRSSLENVRREVGRAEATAAADQVRERDATDPSVHGAAEAGTWSLAAGAAASADVATLRRSLPGAGPIAVLVTADRRTLCAARGVAGSAVRVAVTRCLQLFTARRTALERIAGERLAPGTLTLRIVGEFGDDAEMVLSLGAAGSFVEQPLAEGRRPFLDLVDVTPDYAARVGETLARFPAFYSSYVGLRVAPVAASGS